MSLGHLSKSILSCGWSPRGHSRGFIRKMLHGCGAHSKGIEQAMQGLWPIAPKTADCISYSHIQGSPPPHTLISQNHLLTCVGYTGICGCCQCSEVRIIWLILTLIVLGENSLGGQLVLYFLVYSFELVATRLLLRPHLLTSLATLPRQNLGYLGL